MKTLSIVLCLVFFTGCANNNNTTISRSQIHTGMTFTQVQKLYGCDYSDPNTYEICTKLNESLEIVKEEAKGDCTLNTYRYWLSDSSAKKPYLLTFQSCHLPNYDAVQKEKKRRLDILRDTPGVKESTAVFCKEQGLEPGDEEIILEALALSVYKDNPLPRCTTDSTLVKIAIDTGRTVSAADEKQKDKGGLFSAIAEGAWWVIETTAKGTAINRNNPYTHSAVTTNLDSQSGGLQVDAYGPGIHMNQYGQPVTLRPDFGGVPGESLQIQEDAYGLGVHMDQYGRPVREYSWP